MTELKTEEINALYKKVWALKPIEVCIGKDEMGWYEYKYDHSEVGEAYLLEERLRYRVSKYRGYYTEKTYEVVFVNDIEDTGEISFNYSYECTCSHRVGEIFETESAAITALNRSKSYRKENAF